MKWTKRNKSFALWFKRNIKTCESEWRHRRSYFFNYFPRNHDLSIIAHPVTSITSKLSITSEQTVQTDWI